MRVLFRSTALAAITLGIGALTAVHALAADLKVGFITSLSGPVSSLGIPYDKGFRPHDRGAQCAQDDRRRQG
jgi:branched-chain amino acid transport system substrate-binding protein